MKTNSKYNKSEIMKEAWSMFSEDYDGIYSFATYLKWAWNSAKSDIEGTNKVADKLETMNVKQIFNALYFFTDKFSMIRDEVLTVVKSNSKSFQKDIATKALDGISISEKQAWCIAYEYKKVA